MQAVESTAAAHRGFQQLYDIASFHRDSGHLYAQMSSLGAEGPGGGESMATYVFSRLAQEGRISELHQLPDDFNEVLEAWLETQVPPLPPPSLRQNEESPWWQGSRVGHSGC
jgi:hypothetical protein